LFEKSSILGLIKTCLNNLRHNHLRLNLKNLSFGSRFAIIAVCSTILTVALLATTAYQQLVTDFEDVLTQRQQLETETYASQVNQRLKVRLSALGALAAQMTDGEKLLPPETLNAMLRRQTLLSDYFDLGLLAFDANSVAIAEDRYVENRLGTSYADRSHFKQAMSSEKPYISRPIMGRTTGIPLISFLYPVHSDNNELLGFAGGVINLSNTSLLPDTDERSGDAVFKVLDTKFFTRVDSVDPGNLMPPLPDPGQSELIDAALSGITSGVVEDKSGKRWIYATRHLERVGWLFLRATPYSQAIAPARASFNQFVVISAMVLLVMAILVLALSRTVSRPLEQMAGNMRNMTEHMNSPGRLNERGAPEIRSVARAFNRLMDEREALDDLKSQFVSNVSHELRTPLTSISGSLKLLASGKAGALPDKASTMVDVALRNSEQLQRLIADLLDFNKAVAGQLVIQSTTVSLRSALEDACGANQSYAREHNVSLEVTRAPDIQLMTDPHRLRQVLDNFISNACKFSPTGSTITLSTSRESEEKARIIVSNPGDGVPEYFVPRLFQRFAQAESGSRQAKAGTGLGLAICRELAHLMNGEVGYYYQAGAHFWIELPVDTRKQGDKPDENA
jgi:signal transduction histidine kinase